MEEKKGENVRVAIRVRPMSKKEIDAGETSCVVIADGNVNLIMDGATDAQYSFDMLYDMDCTQEAVYEGVGEPALKNTLSGYNGTIFAYGQTGSGKTFCMTGIPELPGIIPRVNDALFTHIKTETDCAESHHRFLVVCSFFEIYNEIIFDLLNPPQDKSKLGGGLQIKEHPVLGIYVKDLQEIVVGDTEKINELISRGTKSRAVSCTLMNATSSRSHSVFTIKVHQKDDEDTSKNVFAKLNLVDLAGSERQKGTGASGQTLKEGANINKSLSALGNVINALVEAATKKVFIPYRNSKLTRVLQESLGGNSLCTMLATLSPAAVNFEETLSTVRYANRAKAIKVSAKKNEEASHISRLQAEVAELKKILANQKGGELNVEEKKHIQDQYERQIMEMNSFMKQTWEDKAKLSRKHEEQLTRMQEERNRVTRKMEEERSKRWRLLQEQNDVQLSLKHLLDAVHPLGSVPGSAPEHVQRTIGYVRPTLVSDWRSLTKEIQREVDEIRAQREAVRVFKTAFDTDISHWVDSAEYSLEVHDSVSCSATRRAVAKLAKMRSTMATLVSSTSHALKKIGELKTALKHGIDAWSKHGRDAMTCVLEPRGEAEGGKAQVKTAEQDVSRGMKLVARQIRQVGITLLELANCDMASVAEEVTHAAKTTGAKSEGGVPAALQEHLDRVEALVAGQAAKNVVDDDNSLAQYTPQDCAGSTEGASSFLSQVISWDDLPKTKKEPGELLARPPPKFIYDVFSLIAEQTGYLAEVLQDETFADWKNMDSREAKVKFLTAVVKAVGTSLQCEVRMTAADVLKGVNTENTNVLFQLLAIGAKKFGTKNKKKPAGDATEDFVDQSLPVLDVVRVVLDVSRQICEERIEARKQSQPADPMSAGAAEATAKLQRELEEERAAAQQKEKKLLERLEAETKQRLALEEEMDDKDRRLEGLEAEYEQKLESEVGKMEISLQDAQSQNSDLRTRIGTLDDERYRTLSDACASMSDGDLKAQVTAELGKLRSSLTKREEQNRALHDENRSLREEKADAEADLAARLEDGLADSREGRASFRDMTPRRQRTAEEHPLSDAKERKRRLEVQRQLAELQDDFDQRCALGSTRSRGDEDLETVVLELQAENQKIHLRAKQMECELAELDEARETAVAQHDLLADRTQELEGELEDKGQDLAVVSEERDALVQATEQTWREKAAVEDELDRISEGYVVLTDRLNEEKDQTDAATEQVSKYEDLVRELRDQLTAKAEQLVVVEQARADSESAAVDAKRQAEQISAQLQAIQKRLKAQSDQREKQSPRNTKSTDDEYGDDFENEADFM